MQAGVTLLHDTEQVHATSGSGVDNSFINAFHTVTASAQHHSCGGLSAGCHRRQLGALLLTWSLLLCRSSTEYKLLLYRHWSLYDAMVYSPDIAARLRTFKEGSGGRGTLEVILALTGIPLAQVRCPRACPVR